MYTLFGATALHQAIEDNKLDYVKRLLAKGEDINKPDDCKRTPLHFATHANEDDSHLDVIETLVCKNADVDAIDDEGHTPFYYLIRYATLKTVKAFLNLGTALDVVDNDGQTLLFAAAHRNKDPRVVQLFIDLGLDVNHRNELGITPLHWACFENHNAIKCLMKNGACVDSCDEERCTPLINLIYGFNVEDYPVELITKYLIFIMEHVDFSLILEDDNILTITAKANDSLLKLILQHLAKLNALNISVRQDLLDTIAKNKKFNDYYKLCIEELSKAKSGKLKNSWVSFFNLLVDGRKKLQNYAANKDLITNFTRSKVVKRFPIYGTSIAENVKKGIKRQKLFVKSSILLSECLPIFDPTHLIIKDILECILSKKDLTKFCEIN